MSIKAFTLIHLSTAVNGSFNMDFKSKSAHTVNLNILRLSKWSIVRTLGKTTAKAETYNSTLRLKVKNFPYAKSAGVI
jgi:hypothetical protein